MPGHDIVTIGASAGGLPTLRELTGALSADLPASLFVVLHVTDYTPFYLPSILAKASPLPVIAAEDGMPIERGKVYLAPPDRHLLLTRERIQVVRGPKENRHRPAIDPLFRSAAWTLGSRVVGVVLSGTMDDGAAGLWAIKSCGGITVVQDPQEALHSDMPMSALLLTKVDYCVRVREIAELLPRLAAEPARDESTLSKPKTIRTENELVAMHKDIEDMEQLGTPSAFTCPSCHGALWELTNGDIPRFRCHVGHGFSAESLVAAQGDATERAVFSALRALEEKAVVFRRIAQRLAGRLPDLHRRYTAQAMEAEHDAGVVRRLLARRPLPEAK
jgi:two-component system chemotaxis response regulator CheB